MADLTLAASEGVARRLFEAVRDDFSFSDSDSGDFGPFTAGYAVQAHLEGGTLDLKNDGTIQVNELDIKWDQLDVTLGIDIPEICVGGFCIIPNPFGGCILRAPRICVFESDPDIQVTLPLGGFTSEISFAASPKTVYEVDPARPAGMNAWDAQDADPSLANTWSVYIDPVWIDVDPIDIADTVGDLLETLVDAALDSLLGWLPGWAKDIIRGILGGVIDLIRDILDIVDDVDEWLSDLLNVSLGLLDVIGQFVLDYFAADMPLIEIEDPYPILEAATNPNGGPQLVPVKVPIRDFVIAVNTHELTIEANVG